MSLTDVGLQFKMTGADSFESKLNSMKSAYDSLSSSTGKGVDMSPHLQKMTGHLDAAHNKISGFFKLTEGAILAFLAGSAVKGLANWITGGQGGRDIDKMKDFIRYKGADKAYMDAVGDKMKELSQRRPFDTQDAWNAQEQVISMTGPKRPDLAARATEAAANLGYALGGPKGSSNAAMDFARGAIESYGGKLDPEGKTALLEKLGPLLKYVTDTTQTKGHDIELIFQQIASLYANSGKSIEEAFADAGILGGALGPQGGEVLKNIVSKQGTSYGKLMAEADKQDYLVRLKRKQFPSMQSEADLPEELRSKINKAQKSAEMSYAAEGGRLAAAGNIREVMARIIAAKERLDRAFPIMGKDPLGVMSETFGETSIKGFGNYAEAIASGRRQKMISDMKQVPSGGLTEQIDTQQQSLGSKADALDQAVAGLSKEFRRIFEPAAVGIIDAAKEAFVGMRSQLDTLNKEGGLAKNMKEYVAAAIGAYRNVGTDQEGPQKSFDEIFKEFAQSLASGGWAESGQKLGTAIGEFATAATKFGELIGMLHAPIAGFQAAKKKIESWFPQTDPKDASTSEKATGTLGSLGIANLARKAVGWKTGLFSYLFGGTDKEPWPMLGNMATGAGIGTMLGIGPFAGAAGGWAAHQYGKLSPLEGQWAPRDPIDVAAEIWRGGPTQSAPAPKPEVNNEVEANIDEERLTDWLTIKIKTILKGLGGQQDQSWQNSQDWGAGGTSGP